jgi:N-acetylglucosamine transport system permease protein
MPRKKRAHTLFIGAFLLPATLLYGLFVVWPVAQAFAFSLYRWRGVSEQKTFIGLENFTRLFADPIFWQALKHNFQILFGASTVLLILSLALAHAMQSGGWAERALRSVYLFPQVISLVAVSILWMFIYNPTFGIVNGALRDVRMGEYATAWLGTPSTALPAVGVTYIWHGLGFYIMLFSAGLRTIPDEVYEAATLDGAGGLLRFFRITLPLLWAVMRVALIYLVINAFNLFALVFLMTDGGPDRSSEVLLTYLYEQAMKNSNFGFATALAVVNFLVVMALSGMVLGLMRRDPQEGRT